MIQLSLQRLALSSRDWRESRMLTDLYILSLSQDFANSLVKGMGSARRTKSIICSVGLIKSSCMVMLVWLKSFNISSSQLSSPLLSAKWLKFSCTSSIKFEWRFTNLAIP